MDRRLLGATALSLALAGIEAPALDADGGKAKNVIYEARVPAQTGTGNIQFSIDTSPIIFYLATVNAKYHVLLLRVRNDTSTPLTLSKDQTPTPSAEGRTAARLRSRVSHRHSVCPAQPHFVADAPAGTRVWIGGRVGAVSAERCEMRDSIWKSWSLEAKLVS